MNFQKIKGCGLSMLLLWTVTTSNGQNTDPPAVCYEIFVRSFADSNGDGIGDINGITSRLDYLKELGVDALWLTPLCKSPTYHKYDVMDYRQIDPEFGTMDDFKRLLAEAHKREIRIIKDLVINHTSDQHPWFQQARTGKQNPYRDYYVWLDQKSIDSLGIATREKSGDSWEVNPWHSLKEGGAEKYYGLFWGGMPDLNFDNPKVRQEIYAVADFWLTQVGVDGFRLDAAKHIYPDWEADKSHAFWIEFRENIRRIKPDAYLVGEVWSTPEKVAPYFKGLPANFNVDAALAIHQMLRSGEPTDLIGQLQRTYRAYEAANPGFIDAIFANNHDHVRIGTTAGGDIDRMKLAASLLLTLPGEPYLYYGEEIGMLGNKPDEHIREPFLWREHAQDQQRTRWMKPTYSTDQSVRNLEAQIQDSSSLYHHYKTLIQLRHQFPALRQVAPVNLLRSDLAKPGVIAFTRPHLSGDVFVIHNMSGAEKTIELPAGIKGKRLLFASSRKTSIAGSKLEIPAYASMIFAAN